MNAPLAFEDAAFIRAVYISHFPILIFHFDILVNSKPDHPLGKPQGHFYERANSPTPAHKESVKLRPLRQKNRAKTPPPGQLFSKIQQKTTKHEMINNMFRNTVNYRSPKLLDEWLIWIFQISQIILKPTQEIHYKQVPKYDFNK